MAGNSGGTPGGWRHQSSLSAVYWLLSGVNFII